MSSDAGGRAVIRAEGLTKYYELGQSASLTRTGQALAAALLRRPAPRPKVHKAVAKVTFEVNQGECFTVLGRNGSGKTTLVSMLAGITIPTAGRLEITGRVLPLLAIGNSFEPELTGAENAVLLATLIGVPRGEIAAAMPAIKDFSELTDDQLATPVKRFSEGMKARLAFATALRLPADVYIFDEVLNFTDDSFKARCIDEISRLADQGRSVVFISHELGVVRRLCTRGIWMDAGRLRLSAEIDELAEAYAEAGLAHA